MAVYYFVIYSFLGFLLEVVFAWVTGQPKRDRKCLYLLPLCPVYGLGALAVLSLPEGVRGLWLVMLGGLVATAVEALVGLWDRHVLGVQFWDYTGLPGAWRGVVCLPFFLAWGVLSWALVTWLHPMVARWAALLPRWAVPAAALLVLGDLARSAVLLRRSGTTDVLKWYAS